jgi:hypothetical protein
MSWRNGIGYITPSKTYKETGRMLLKALSQTLVKEHNFKFTVNAETHVFLVEELGSRAPGLTSLFIASRPRRIRCLGRGSYKRIKKKQHSEVN